MSLPIPHRHSQSCFGRQGDRMVGPICGFAQDDTNEPQVMSTPITTADMRALLRQEAENALRLGAGLPWENSDRVAATFQAILARLDNDTNESQVSFLKCNNCGKCVSTAFYPVPTDTPDKGIIVRAWIECPECLEKRISEAYSNVKE